MLGHRWVTIALIVWSVGMIVFVVNAVEAMRENKDRNIVFEQAPHNGYVRAVLALCAIVLAPVWPWFTALAVVRWIGLQAARGSAKLRAIADSHSSQTPGSRPPR